MRRACRPLTAWRRLALPVCAIALLAPRNVGSQPCVPCPRASFGDAPRSFYAGSGPVSVAVADFDEDGAADLVVASNLSSPSQITILRGSGTGYALLTTLPVSVAPRGVATADFDLDGHADFVAALGSLNLGQVQLFLGTGTGGFTPRTPLPVGTNASAVVVGDFNRDSVPDVAVASEGSNDVRLFLGNGAGDLALTDTKPVGSGPRSVAAADLDGDGKLDLAVANSGSTSVTLLFGNGDGTFETPGTTLAMGTGPWSVAVGLFNADGIPDLVTANHDASPDGTVSVRLGLGSRTYGAPTTFTVDAAPTAVAALDLTADGRVDIAVAAGSGNTLDLLVGDGSGGFALSGPLPLPAPPLPGFPVRTNPQGLAEVDADADGHPDLVIACKDSDSVAVLLARPPGPPAFAAAVRVGVGAQPMSAVSVDFDRDGYLDLAVANSTDGTVSRLLNDRAGGFNPQLPAVPAGPAPDSIVAADFNQDVWPDLAVNNATAGTVRLLLNNQAGGFTPQQPIAAGTAPDELGVGDFNHDGWPDLAVCNKQPNGKVAVLLGNGSGGFNPAVFYPPDPNVLNTPTSVAVADLDGDGNPDLAVAIENADSLAVFWGDAVGRFPAMTTLGLLSGDTKPVSVTIGDFDGDGRLDLATAVFETKKIALFRNLGSRSFSTPTTLAAVNLPLFVTAADLNSDGKPDLAVAAAGLKVLRGKGAMGFEADQDFVAGLGTRALALGDFNGDGLPDVAVVNDTSNDVSILLSTACAPRRLRVDAQPATCGTGPAPYTLQAHLQALDDGGNNAICASGTVTAAIVPGTGTPGAILGGITSVPLASGQASFDALTIDRAGPRYRLQFDLAGATAAVSRRFTLGLDVAITGPAAICPLTPSAFTAGPGYDSYRWLLDGATSFLTPSAFSPTVTVTSPPVAVGSHTLSVTARTDGCTPTDTKGFYAGDLDSVALTVAGPVTVCVNCIGGTATATETGGGVPLGHQWGYRTVPLGTITPIPGETGPTYVIKGSDLPGPGDYYLVVTTTPTCGSALTSNEQLVTVSAVVPSGEARYLGVTSRGSPGNGENVLQWVNTAGSPEEILIRWNKAASPAATCTAPLDTLAPASGQYSIPNPPAGSKGQWSHSGLELDTAYCYSLFVKTGGTYSPGRLLSGRPFDSTAGPVKWAYATGATAVAPPVVGVPGILAMSNDRTVHSVMRGSTGGLWPTDWVPTGLTGVAHSRSPAVPFAVPVSLANHVLFAGDDAGYVYAVNAETGQSVWSPADAGTPITGAPGGLFQQYGGVRDLIVVGTRNLPPASSALLGLDLTGAIVGSFTGSLGAILGAPALDYASSPQRVYFTSRSLSGTGSSVWCLDIGPASPVFTLKWQRHLGDIDASPVVRGGRVYVATNAGEVLSLPADTGGAESGADDHVFDTGDGAVKGFVFPDRRNQNVIFATSTKVWSIADTGATMPLNWSWTWSGLQPSVVLYWPGTSYVYVGSTNGQLFQLDFSAATPALPPTVQQGAPLVLGSGVARIGAPSLDTRLNMLLVGSESGVLYGVEVPLP